MKIRRKAFLSDMMICFPLLIAVSVSLSRLLNSNRDRDGHGRAGDQVSVGGGGLILGKQAVLVGYLTGRLSV